MPNRIHYYALAIFAFLVAFVPLAFSLSPRGAELRQPAIVAVCVAGIAIAPCFLYLGHARRFEFKESAFRAVLLYSIVGPFICHLYLDHLRSTILTLYMLGPIGAAFFSPMRRALPLIALGVATILYVSATIAEPDAMLRGVLVAVITVSCSLMLYAMKRHLARALRLNRELSERDALTGAYNLRKFRERLDEEVARSRRDGEAFALIEFDLDQFKPVNDTYNHTIGDAVLVAAAGAIESVLTPADLLVRRGGDEFAVIAPGAPGRDFTALAERARRRIAEARRGLCPDLLPTASVGLAIHDHDETADDLVQRVEQALNGAKRSAAARASAEFVRRSEAGAGAGLNAAPRAQVLTLPRGHNDPAAIGDDPLAGAMRIAWLTAGTATLVLSIVLAALGVAGKTSFAFSPVVIGLLVVWAFVMSPFAFWASTRSRQPMFTAYLLSAGSLALIAAGCLAIGKAAPVTVEMFLLANLTFMALLPTRPAILYSTTGFALYGYFLYASGYALSDIRLATTVVNFSCAGGMVATSRHRTLQAASEKAELARTDALTGLPNMRRLRDRLAYEIQRCETTGGSLAVLALDLDQFKSVNDVHSHTTGDRVLKAVADALDRGARHADMPARRGGDEFMVVLTDADARDAEAAAQRVADAIRRARLQVVADINPNASVGWVAWKPGNDVDELIHRADAALKRVKLNARRERHDAARLA